MGGSLSPARLRSVVSIIKFLRHRQRTEGLAVGAGCKVAAPRRTRGPREGGCLDEVPADSGGG